MDFATMVDSVQDTVDDTSSAGETRIKRYLNFAQNDIASRFDWPWMKASTTFSTTANDEEYSLDSTCHKVINMRDETNERFLQEVDDRNFDMNYPYVDTTNDTGDPQYWRASTLDSSLNQQVKLYPVPDGTYTIRYRYFKRLTDMSGDTDTSIVPAKYHKLMVDYACGMYWQKEQEPIANNFFAIYENAIREMLDDIIYESDAPSTIKTTYKVRGVKDLRF